MGKTTKILEVIERKKLVSLTQLTLNTSLIENFESSPYTPPRRRIIDACKLLAQRGFVSVGTLDGEKVYKITLKGLQKLKRDQLLTANIENCNFTGRWYIVTVDFPQSKRIVRNQIILLLKRNEFVSYSTGVWILPYNCTKYIGKIREYYSLKSELQVIVATHIDNQATYAKIYGI